MPKVSRRTTLEIVAGSAAAWLANSLPLARAQSPTGKQPIKIGQIGVGHAHASKLDVYRESPDYEVVGIAEADPELRARAKERDPYRDLPWMTQEQLLNVPGLQAVLVETHVRDSLNVAESCIAAGQHVHLDKPAGESLPQYQRILTAAEQKGLLVQMGYMYRYSPAVQLMREMVAKGWLGELFEVHTVMSKVVPPADRVGLAEYRGGIMFELGCHIIDLVVGVLGAPAKVTPFPRQVVTGQDKLLDNMLAVFEYPRATASVKSSAVEVSGFDRRHFVACGTEGTFHIQPLDRPAVRLALSQNRDKYRRGYQDVALPPFRRYVADAADMARIIRGEKQSDFSYAHDLAVQTALLRACGNIE